MAGEIAIAVTRSAWLQRHDAASGRRGLLATELRHGSNQVTDVSHFTMLRTRPRQQCYRNADSFFCCGCRCAGSKVGFGRGGIIVRIRKVSLPKRYTAKGEARARQDGAARPFRAQPTLERSAFF